MDFNDDIEMDSSENDLDEEEDVYWLEWVSWSLMRRDLKTLRCWWLWVRVDKAVIHLVEFVNLTGSKSVYKLDVFFGVFFLKKPTRINVVILIFLLSPQIWTEIFQAEHLLFKMVLNLHHFHGKMHILGRRITFKSKVLWPLTA